jgi:hypothetical protein
MQELLCESIWALSDIPGNNRELEKYGRPQMEPSNVITFILALIGVAYTLIGRFGPTIPGDPDMLGMSDDYKE